MRYLLILVLLGSGLIAQTPGVPTNLQVGTFSCAARIYAPTQLQVWCFKDTAQRVLATNVLTDISQVGLDFLTCDNGDVNTGTCIIWDFVVDTTVQPIKVTWRAKISKASVDGPILIGIL